MFPWSLQAPPSILFSWGPFTLHWYGLLFVCGFLCASYVVWRRIAFYKNVGEILFPQRNSWLDIVNGLTPLFLWGIVGARLWEVTIVNPAYYFSRPLAVFALHEGGLAFHGGIIAGGVYLLWKLKNETLSAFDLFSPAVALGQAIGRWGNYFNQELFGVPTNAWWGIFIDPLRRPEGYKEFATFTPTFFIESASLAVIGILLIYISPVYHAQQKKGYIFAWYLIGSGIIRFFVEIIRLDPVGSFAGLRYPQWVSLGMIVIGIMLIAMRASKIFRDEKN